jgi:hypothetical protein
MFSVGFRLLLLHDWFRYSHSVARIQVALFMLGRSFECVKTSMVGLVDLVVTRISSLVTGRSWLSLPNKFPFVGGRGSSVQELGDVSANGLTAGCRSVDTEHVDEIVSISCGDFSCRKVDGEGRWGRTIQSYHDVISVKSVGTVKIKRG